MNCLTESDVAKLLKVSLPTLRRWRAAKEGPKFVHIGRLVRYTESEVETFISGLVGRHAEAVA
jgi:excisionase family DNA binding protein